MKPFSFFYKVVSSVVILLTFLYVLLVFVFVIPFNDKYITYLHSILMILSFAVTFFLILKILKYKTLKSDTKYLWILLLVLFTPSQLYYIWKKDNEFIENENK